jgi:hypothetical protein
LTLDQEKPAPHLMRVRGDFPQSHAQAKAAN